MIQVATLSAFSFHALRLSISCPPNPLWCYLTTEHSIRKTFFPPSLHGPQFVSYLNIQRWFIWHILTFYFCANNCSCFTSLHSATSISQYSVCCVHSMFCYSFFIILFLSYYKNISFGRACFSSTAVQIPFEI